VSGSANTGVEIVAEKDQDPTIRLHSDNDGEGIRAYLGVSATSEDGRYGINFGFKGDPLNLLNVKTANTLEELNPVKFDYARAWGKFLDDKLKVIIGSTGSAWDTDQWNWADWDNLMGIRFEVAPIGGLNFGAALPLPATGGLLADAFKKTVFGAKYRNDAFIVNGMVKLDLVETAVIKSNVDAHFGAVITAVPDFKITAESYIYDIGYKDKTHAGFWESVVWTNSPLTLGTWFWEKVDISDTDAASDDYTKFAFYARPYVEYQILHSLKLGFRVGFTTGMASDQVNVDGDGVSRPDLSYQVDVRPYLAYTVGSNATIRAWYQLTTSKTVDDVSALKNTVQISFDWSW
jgi:hypothetical protein